MSSAVNKALRVIREQADEIERLQKRNALLEDVAAAADDLSNPRDSRPYRDVADALDAALDKLREAGDE